MMADGSMTPTSPTSPCTSDTRHPPTHNSSGKQAEQETATYCALLTPLVIGLASDEALMLARYTLMRDYTHTHTLAQFQVVRAPC